MPAARDASSQEGSDGLRQIIESVSGHEPQVARTAWVAPSAAVLGHVLLHDRTSIWYGAILRAEDAPIVVGRDSNIQDGSVIHTDPGFATTIGEQVSVGHRAVIHGSTIEDECLVGMGAVVMNGAVIGKGSLVAAGAVVLEGTIVPPGSLVAGVPASVRRPVTADERASIVLNAENYLKLARAHRL